MRSEPFREPVIVYMQHPDGMLRRTNLSSTKEAYDALMKGNVPVADPVWHQAMHATVKALLDPKPEMVEASRRALEQLANYRAARDPQNRRTLH